MACTIAIIEQTKIELSAVEEEVQGTGSKRQSRCQSAPRSPRAILLTLCLPWGKALRSVVAVLPHEADEVGITNILLKGRIGTRIGHLLAL